MRAYRPKLFGFTAVYMARSSEQWCHHFFRDARRRMVGLSIRSAWLVRAWGSDASFRALGTITWLITCHIQRLTNRWSQPLAVVKSTFDFMNQVPMFATLVLASGGSAPSR
jgi:hypothetical protein